MPYREVDHLRVRAVYRIRSRNLRVAVYVGNGEFTGIREKFGDRYLFSESATVQRVEPDPIAVIPPDVPLGETLGTRCMTCGESARWTGPPAPAPWECGGGCEMPRPVSVSNDELFRLLDGVE